MVTTDPPVHPLDASQLRRLVGRLCLRPGERILLLGHGNEVLARLAAYLVGPGGEVVEAGYDSLPSGGSSPLRAGEFDAVLAGAARTLHPDQLSVLVEAGRVTAPTGRVAFAAVPPADGDPAGVSALVAEAGLRGTGVQLDAGTSAGAEPVFLVTAFPPKPTGAATAPATAPAATGRRRRAGNALKGRRTMSQRTPLLTLLTGAGVAAVLLMAGMAATGGPDDEPAGAGGTAPGASSTPAAEASAPAPERTPEPEPEPVTYVGWVDGGGASVAIIVDGDDTVAYVCDGAAAEAWLLGSARDGELDLAGEGGSLVASYDHRRVIGQATVAGRSWTFTAAQVAAPEGLYRFADTIAGGAEVVGGWIVLPDGSQVGVLAVDGDPGPAPRLDPGTGVVTIDGDQFAAERQG
jgi:serine/threonine-protein kinase